MSESESPPPWEVLESEPLAEYSMFGVRRERVRSPRDGAERDFHVVESPDGVTVLALTPEDRLVLVEQYRVPRRALSLETPSGVIDEGETPIEAGLRELREETGYRCPGAELLGTLELNPSWQTTRVHVVLARAATCEGPRELDAGEDTRVRTTDLDEVFEMVRQGRIRSTVVVAALGLLALSGAGRPSAAPPEGA